MLAIPPKWNFQIWSSFDPQKIHSPRSTSCWCKRWQQGGFHAVFGPFDHPEPDEMLQKFLSMHKLPCKTQKCKYFLQRVSRIKVSTLTRYPYSGKICFWTKIFQSDKNFSEFAQILSKVSPSCIMPSQQSLSQNPEWIRPFPPF